MLTEQSLEKRFHWALGITLAVKIALAAAIPFTSDEAYFALWGRFPAPGYYDHPPMIGWILAGFSLISSSPLFLRLPAILVSSGIGLGLYLLLRRYDRVAALLAATLYLVSPINVLFVLISTDTPLILFTFLSVAFMFRAEKHGRAADYLLSGVFLGCAFLSKYFAVLLGVVYAVRFCRLGWTRERARGYAMTAAAALPFVAFNAIWNYENGWPNILFNLFNRNRNEAFSVGKFMTYAACQLYLLTPPVIYFLFRNANDVMIRGEDDAKFGLFRTAYLVPLALFGVLSVKKVIGLHWALSFYPFLFVVLFVVLERHELERSIRIVQLFTLLHLAVIAVALSLPLKLAFKNKNYPTIIIGTQTASVVAQLAQLAPDGILATRSYAQSALMEFSSRRRVIVFGGGSFHARHDDIMTDFRALQGKTITILVTENPRIADYTPFFESVRVLPLPMEGVLFRAVIGRGFNYEAYRAAVLSEIRASYYSPPAWLLRKPSAFEKKYFPAAVNN